MKKNILLLIVFLLSSCTGAGTRTLPAETNGNFSSVTDIAQSVVKLGMLNEEYIAVGNCTGTIIDPRGLILTNFHCVGNNNNGALHNPDGLLEVYQTHDYASPPKFAFYARVVEEDKDADLAVLQIVRLQNGTTPTECLALPAMTVNSTQVAIEAPVRAVGYPGFGGETLTVTEGNVAGIKKFGEASAERPGDHVAIKMTAPVGHGNSGGALINAQNELVGVPFYLFQDSAGSPGQMYYAVAASEAADIIAQAGKRSFPGCDDGAAAVLTHEVSSFPRSAVYGKITYVPVSGAPFEMSDATIYLFDATHDVQSLTAADIQTALVRTTTSYNGMFAAPLTQDQYEHELGVVVVYQDRIVLRENNVKLTEQVSPDEDYEKRRTLASGTDSIVIDTFFTALNH